MFPQLKRLNNKSGMVLFIVLMTAIIMMIVTVGILDQSLNEISYAQQQIDQIASDQLSKGMFWNSYSTGPGMPNENASNPLDGRTYNTELNVTTQGYINSYTVITNFDTFN